MKTERTIEFLMANLGSEISRFFILKEQGDLENAELSARRSLDIISKLMENKAIGNGRKELEILKNIIEDALSESNVYAVTMSELNSYFLPFAEAASAG